MALSSKVLRFLGRLVLLSAAFSLAVEQRPAAAQAPRMATPAQAKAIADSMKREPLAIFIATGPRNACGTNCDEWISIDGSIDEGSAKRVRDFLDRHNDKRRAVFINSRGGALNEARQIGETFRERRMAVGIGRTLPQNCRSMDRDCRVRVQKLEKAPARLQTAGAFCSSACVYAFIGGTSRNVASDARLRIHSSIRVAGKPPTPAELEQAANARKVYVLKMGVDPALIDVINKVPFEAMRDVTRSEITRLGIESAPRYETPWVAMPDSRGRFYVMKALTQSSKPDTDDVTTTLLAFSCFDPQFYWFNYRRERSSKPVDSSLVVRLENDDRLNFVTANPQDGRTNTNVLTATTLLRELAARKEFHFLESRLSQPESVTEMLKISTANLSAGLDRLEERCKPLAETSRSQPASAQQ